MPREYVLMIQQSGHDFILTKDGADQLWFAPSFSFENIVRIERGSMYKISCFWNNKK